MELCGSNMRLECDEDVMLRIFVRFIDVDLCFFISIASVIVQESVRKLFLYEKNLSKKSLFKKKY